MQVEGKTAPDFSVLPKDLQKRLRRKVTLLAQVTLEPRGVVYLPDVVSGKTGSFLNRK